MSVAARINRLPASCTDADVNKLEPEEEEEETLEVSINTDEELPHCCAVLVCGDAEGYSDFDGEKKPLTPRYLDAFKEALESELESVGHKGLILYTLTDNQVTEREGLLAVGFEIMAEFKNPNTNNRITLFGKLVNQPRQAAKQSPAKKKPKRR